MKICIVVPYDLAEEGGVKRNAIHVAEVLRAMGDEVTLVGPLSRGAPDLGVHGFGGVVNVSANVASNRMALLTPPWSVQRFFRAHSFDVVHIHEPLVPVLPYYALWSSPPSAHVCTFHMYAEDESPAWGVARRAVARAVFASFERGIAVSRPAAMGRAHACAINALKIAMSSSGLVAAGARGWRSPHAHSAPSAASSGKSPDSGPLDTAGSAS